MIVFLPLAALSIVGGDLSSRDGNHLARSARGLSDYLFDGHLIYPHLIWFGSVYCLGAMAVALV